MNNHNTCMVLDLAHLAEVTGSDSEFESEILGDFLSFAADAVCGIRNALMEGDTETLIRCAHSLKGSARSVGAAALADCAESVERLSATADSDGLQQAVRSVDDALAAFQIRATEHLGSKAA